MLAIELQFLVDSDLSFDVELTGFEMGEIDVLLASDISSEKELVEQPDADAPVVSDPVISG